MHAKTWAWAAVLAFTSTAVADHGRSRVYFPHHVKRQTENSTETPEEISSSESVVSVTPLPSTDDQSAPESSYPPTSDDKAPSTDDDNDSENNAPATNEPVSERRSDSSVSETPSRGLPDIDDILTLSLPHTVDVSSTTSSAAAGTPDIVVSPTPSEGEGDAESETDEETTPTTSDGIVLAPTGLLGGGLTGLPDLGLGDKTSSESVGSESSGNLNPTAPGGSKTTNDNDAAPTSPSDSSSTADEQTVPSASENASSGTGGLLDPIIDPIASLVPSASDDGPAGTGAEPSGTGGLLDPIVDPIESLIPDPTNAHAAPTGSETSASDSLVDPSVEPAESSIPTPTEAAPSGTGILDPIVDPVQSLVSSAVDDLTIPPALNFTSPTGTGVAGSESAVTLLPTVPEAVPSLTGVPIPDIGTNGSDPNTNPAGPGYTNPVGPDPTAPPGTSLPVNPTNMTIPIPGPTASATASPTGDVAPPPGSNSTTPTTILPGDAYTSTSSEESVVTLPPVQNTTIPAPKPTKAPPNYATTVRPVATVTGKEGWLGTQLIADDVTATTNTDLPAPTQSETLPAGMPNSIDASSDVVEQPDGTTLIRIVFDRRLHYEFVADNFTASQQIFMYFPMVIGHGEDIDQEDVKMMRLSPIETKQKKGWVTTAAFAYVPEGIIEALQMDIHLTNSDLYNPPHPIASGIAAAIDPSYGIFPGSDLEGNSEDSEDGTGGTPFGGNDGEEQTASQKGTTAGIAVGAVGAAVAYGAAMFLVARRYKRKKQSHRRSSSISDTNGNSNSPTSDMRFAETGSPATAMMGGALLSRDFSGYGAVAGGSAGGSAGTAGGRHSQGSGQSGAGNSGRTAYISAPVAAENSLGWN